MKIYNAKTAFNTCLVALLIFASTSVFAQQQKQQRTPEERATIATNKMKETLQLSDDQYVKVKAINLDYAKKINERRAVKDKSALKDKMKNLDSQRMRSLKSVLTPDQYAKYETQKNAARERLKKNMELKRRQSQS